MRITIVKNLAMFRRTMPSRSPGSLQPSLRVLGRTIPSIVALVLWLAGGTTLAVNEQVPVGPRAIALGGAFTSIANDATALFWNPAGLATIGHQEITGSRARLFGTDLIDNQIGFVLPLSPKNAIAFDWYHTGFEDRELGFGENRFDLGYAHKLSERLFVGVSGKYLDRFTSLDGTTIEKGNGIGLNLGVLYRPWPRVSLGLVGQDIFDTQLDFSSGDGAEVVYPRTLRLGASYAAHPKILTTLDFDDRVHFGLELTPIPEVTIRSGIQQSSTEDIGPTLSFGAGFLAGVFRFDYAYEVHPVLEATHHLGFSMDFNFNPSKIRIEQVQTEDLYSSLYKTYGNESFGEVLVRNLGDTPLPVTLSIHLPDLMDRPTEANIVLTPKSVTSIPITAILSEKVLGVKAHRQVQTEIGITYQSSRLPRTERRSTRTVTYGSGAISWGLGVSQAAAFITTRDSAVDGLARGAVAAMPRTTRSRYPTTNVAFAAAILAALEELGIRYVPDPNNAYSNISTVTHAVDTIHYPRETLSRRGGDCDDTAVLLASLLGNVGVQTQLVDVPGHLFLLVDTGLIDRNELALSVDSVRYVSEKGKIWIPLETTAIAEGFAAAWDEGAQNYLAWAASGQVQLVDVTNAQSRYEAPDLKEDPVDLEVSPQALLTKLERDANLFEQWQGQFLSARFSTLESGKTITEENLNEMAKVLFLSGKFDEARSRLEQALEIQPTALTLSNLASVLIAEGEVEAAEEMIARALEYDEDDAGIWLNLGLLRSALGDISGADIALGQSLTLAGGPDEAIALLGIGEAPSSSRQGSVRMTVERAKAVIRDVASLLFPSAAAIAKDLPSQNKEQQQALPAPLDPDSDGFQSPAGNSQENQRNVTGTTDGPDNEGDGNLEGPPDQEDRQVDDVRPVPSLTAVFAWSKADEPVQIQHVLYWKDQ